MRFVLALMGTTLFSAAALADGPVFSRAGGIAAPGPTPSYWIDPVTGTGHFKVLDPNAAVGASTLGAMVNAIAAQQTGMSALAVAISGEANTARSAETAASNAAAAAATTANAAAPLSSLTSEVRRAEAAEGLAAPATALASEVSTSRSAEQANAAAAAAAQTSANSALAAAGTAVQAAGGNASGTLSTATGGSTARAQSDRLADVVNIMDGYGGTSGAKCDGGATDDSAAINAAVAEFRNRLNQGKAARLVLGRGSCYFKTSLNFTNIDSYLGVIDGTNSTLSCATTGTACIDAVGTQHITWQMPHLNQVGGSPTVGIQIARASASGACGEQKFISPYVAGSFSETAFYNGACESSSFFDPHFENNSTAAVGYALIMDGANHWNVQSSYQPTTWQVDQFNSFNENRFFGGTLVSSGGSGQVWSEGGNRHRYYGVYALGAGGTHGFVIYSPSGTNLNDLTLDMHFEYAPDYDIFLTGPNATPTINGLKYYNHIDQAASAIVGTDTNITAVSLDGADFEVTQTLNGAPAFSNPGIVMAAGQFRMPALTWNLPSSQTQGETDIGGVVALFGRVPVPLTAQASALAPLNGIGTITSTNAALWSIPAGGTNFPQVAITSPQGTGGAPATAAFQLLLLNSNCNSLLSGGTGYTVGDTISPATGTPAAAGGLKCKVTSISGGGSTGPITGLSVLQNGYYSVMPVDTTSVAMTGGTGTGATFHGLTWIMPTGASDFITATARGSGYTTAPVVSFPATPGVSLIGGSPIATAALVPGTLSINTNGGPVSASTVTLLAGGKLNLDSAGTMWVQETSAGKVVIGTGSANLFSVDGSGNVLAKGTIAGSASP